MWDDSQELCHMLCQMIEKCFIIKDIHFLNNDNVQCLNFLTEVIVLSASEFHITIISSYEKCLQIILPQYAAVIYVKI